MILVVQAGALGRAGQCVLLGGAQHARSLIRLVTVGVCCRLTRWAELAGASSQMLDNMRSRAQQLESLVQRQGLLGDPLAACEVRRT